MSHQICEAQKRREKVYQYRKKCAKDGYNHVVKQVSNGDERRYRKDHYFASYTKGLPHNEQGLVDDAAYKSLLHALKTQKPRDFDKIKMAPTAVRKLVNPQAGFGMDLEGLDTFAMTMPPPPRFASAELAAEYVENVWMALLRDVPFAEYTDANPLVVAACQDLSALVDFHGAKNEEGQVTPETLFRTDIPGVVGGPYLSQFFFYKCPFGAGEIEQKVTVAIPNVDFMTTWSEWLAIQRGEAPSAALQLLPNKRYMINGRDLCQWAHIDVLYQAYFQAMLVLLSIGIPTKSTNPYFNNKTQEGFGTLGAPNVMTLVTEVCTRALKCGWYQKWSVHRYLRPEVYGGRLNAVVEAGADFPVNQQALDSQGVAASFEKFGSHLLPMAYPEGSPLHTSYPSGHSVVAGAATTILKAWFQEDFILPFPVVPSADGQILEPYIYKPGEAPLTVGGELNKIAYNVAIGRNLAGVHWRSDAYQSLLFGEQVAISILQEQKAGYNEDFPGWTFTSFEGNVVTIK
jgi:hypothetical protein